MPAPAALRTKATPIPSPKGRRGETALGLAISVPSLDKAWLLILNVRWQCSRWRGSLGDQSEPAQQVRHPQHQRQGNEAANQEQQEHDRGVCTALLEREVDRPRREPQPEAHRRPPPNRL